MQYRNNRIARVGDRVIGTVGSQVVTGIVVDLAGSKIAYQEIGRIVYETVSLGNFFLAEDALLASNAVNNKIAASAPIAPTAPVVQQPIAVVAPPPAPEAPREAVPGWPTA